MKKSTFVSWRFIYCMKLLDQNQWVTKILRGHKNLIKNSYLFWRYRVMSKTSGKLFQILWSSHNIWSLKSTNFLKHLVFLTFFASHKKDLPPYDAFTQKQLSICIVSMSVCQNDLINRHGLCCFVGLIVCLLMAFAHAAQPCHKGNFGCKVAS